MIQADDLDGGGGHGGRLRRRGPADGGAALAGAVPAAPPDAAVLAFDTASRDLDAATAADRAGRVAHWFAGHCDERAWLYKKLDSTLRGNAAAELGAVERALCAAEAPVRGGDRARVPRARADDGGRPPTLGRGGGRCRRLLGDPEDAELERVVVDARRTEDLEALADALEARCRRPLLVGSGGLAAAHAARRQASSRPASRAGETGPVLVVCGSRTPLAARQADVLSRLAWSLTRVSPDEGEVAARALEAGGDVLLMAPEASTPDATGALGRAAARALRTATPRLVIAVGGDTAHGLCAALGVEALWAEREAAPGAPLLHCTLADGRGLRVVMKSGSFGADDLLAQLVADA